MKEKFSLTPAILSDFFEKNRKDIATIIFNQNIDGVISCELGIRTEAGKVRMVSVNNQLFVKPPTERIHFGGLVQARTSGKKRFYQMQGDSTRITYRIKYRRDKNGNTIRHGVTGEPIKDYQYVGINGEVETWEQELLRIDCTGITPEKITIIGVSYYLYRIPSMKGGFTEVITTTYNTELIRAVKYSGETKFTWLSNKKERSNQLMNIEQLVIKLERFVEKGKTTDQVAQYIRLKFRDRIPELKKFAKEHSNKLGDTLLITISDVLK